MNKLKCPEQVIALLALALLALAVELSFGDSIGWSGLALLDWLEPLEAVAQVSWNPLDWNVSLTNLQLCID
ncbi:hypothetical protein L2750_02670 [Shewanella submarina]|uniref:Uncharacterized protein n=1 Tax=Shewanella submarina TaxID=2016376 RepID=A0ABV7GFZ8_9GAMM|nr:hypothetical protein [Shewanella submarina]MCL1036058.1 hypothetical protein [Shewanella submarina]